ncbi:hypothetical protein HF638_23095 [Paenibacillus sp. SZ31]|uniref:hypothetical protein n=1 Tax=Paenibacillus sp. SZ31 TaxID=2725555 RepID=UPI00146A44F9|nr:hypothetical protein [Paenibacillus sp. SZ31]NMI06879.1 hypothetical protein [Paenibacillus sp. SZ31]
MELSIAHGFIELNESALSDINAGGIWGVIGGAAEVVAGVAGIVGGVAALAVPEPTGATKFAGAAAITLGLGAIGSGAVSIASNWK